LHAKARGLAMQGGREGHCRGGEESTVWGKTGLSSKGKKGLGIWTVFKPRSVGFLQKRGLVVVKSGKGKQRGRKQSRERKVIRLKRKNLFVLLQK